jgi:hypothetical protein
MDQHRVVDIHAGGESFGTGYLVTNRLVLTASHVIRPRELGASCKISRLSHPDEAAERPFSGKAIWISTAHDAALVETESAVPGLPADAVRFLRVPRNVAEVPQCTGIGFPEAHITEGVDEDRFISGRLSRVIRRGDFDFNVDHPIPDKSELWGGFSGTSLFYGDVLVAIVKSYREAYGGRVLRAASVELFFDDPEFVRLISSGAGNAQDFLVDYSPDLLTGAMGVENPYSALRRFYCDFTVDLGKADGFIGRDEIFSGLARFQEARPCGYFRVTADAGLGKTALSAAVARRYGASSFFTSAAKGLVGADQCLNHLTVVLITQFDLGYDDLTPDAGKTSNFFSQILKAAVEKANRPLWFVVDALDEADLTPGRNPLLLPPHLPRDAYFFITQRPGSYPLQTDADTPLYDEEIDWRSPLQQGDITAFLRCQSRRPEIANALKALRPPLREDSFIGSVRTASEGNFLYLSYLLSDLAAGQLTSLDALPSGLKGYYGNIWLRMQRSARPEDWEALHRRTIGLLAVAREPVSLPWLAELSGNSPDRIRERVLKAWRPFLARESRGALVRWRLLHRSFGDYLNEMPEEERLELIELHTSVAAHFRTRASWTAHEGYASRHLSAHFRLARDHNELFVLVHDPAWFEYQLLVDSTGMTYQADLSQAWSACSEANAKETGRGQPAPWLAREIHLALATSTLNGLWQHLRPKVLSVLLKLGILSEAQVLQLAERNAHPKARSMALQTLAPLLRGDHLFWGIRIAESIPDQAAKTYALISLAQWLTDEQKRAVLEKARTSARSMENGEDKVEVLRKLAQEFPECERWELREDAVKIARGLPITIDRASALAELARDPPGSLELAEEALAVTREIEDDADGRVEQLCAILGLMPEERQADLADEALSIIRNEVSDPTEKVSALCVLLSNVTRHLRSAILDEAAAAVRTVVDPGDRVNSFLSLVDNLEGPQRASYLHEAENIVREQIADHEARAEALARVAGKLPEERSRSVLRDALDLLATRLRPALLAARLVFIAAGFTNGMRGIVLQKASEAADGVTEPLAKARTLMNLGLELPGDRMREVVQDAVRIPGGILASSRLPQDQAEQVELLSALIPRIDPAHQGTLIRQAISLVEEIERPYDRARALASIASSDKSHSQGKLVPEVCALTKKLDQPVERAELLVAIAPFVRDDSIRRTLLHDAAESARAIHPAHTPFTGTVDLDTGIVIIARSPAIEWRTPSALLAVALQHEGLERDRLLDEAFETAYSLEYRFQADALLTLAPYLSTVQVRGILFDYQSIVRLRLRRELLACVSEWLQASEQPSDLSSGRQNSRTVEDERGSRLGQGDERTDEGPLRRFNLKLLVPLEEMFRLSSGPHPTAFELTFDPELEPQDEKEEIEGQILRSYAKHLVSTEGPGFLRYLADAGHRWNQALGALVRRQAMLESVESAIESARAIWPDRLPLEIICALADRLPPTDPLLADALQLAQNAKDAAAQAAAFAQLIPSLREPARDIAISGLMAALDRILHQEGGTRLFADLIPELPALPAAHLLAVIQLSLRSPLARRDLLDHIRKLVPVLLNLGVPGTADSLAKAIVEETRRWS